MSSTPTDRRYSKEHEWTLEAAGQPGVYRVGITDHAQQQLGDVVFVELPEVGASVEAGTPVGVLESVKTVSDLYSPLSGEVTAVNAGLEDAPELINQTPYDEGWIYEVRASEPGQVANLLDAAAYAELVGGE